MTEYPVFFTLEGSLEGTENTHPIQGLEGNLVIKKNTYQSIETTTAIQGVPEVKPEMKVGEFPALLGLTYLVAYISLLAIHMGINAYQGKDFFDCEEERF